MTNLIVMSFLSVISNNSTCISLERGASHQSCGWSGTVHIYTITLLYIIIKLSLFFVSYKTTELKKKYCHVCRTILLISLNKSIAFGFLSRSLLLLSSIYMIQYRYVLLLYLYTTYCYYIIDDSFHISFGICSCSEFIRWI